MLITGFWVLNNMYRLFVCGYSIHVWLLNLVISLTLCIKLLHTHTKLRFVVLVWTIMIANHGIALLAFNLLILIKKVLHRWTLILNNLFLHWTLRLIKNVRIICWVLHNFFVILRCYTSIFKYFLYLKTSSLLTWD